MVAKKSSKSSKAKAPSKTPSKADPLFPSRPRSFGVGGNIRPTGRDLSRFVRWPKYVRKQRQKESAADAAKGKASTAGVPHQIKFGLKHVTTLIEEKKASLVLIACDVDPIELVLWLPALCRKVEVPFLIVKDKARLGTLVHQKTSAVVALTGVNKEDTRQLEIFRDLGLEKFNNNTDLIRKWGGGVMGLRTQAKLDKRAKVVAAEEAKKAASLKR